jgi:hypothetical protein
MHGSGWSSQIEIELISVGTTPNRLPLPFVVHCSDSFPPIWGDEPDCRFTQSKVAAIIAAESSRYLRRRS